jgi:hypothetical protein
MSTASSAGPSLFPDLADFMGGWFHQDFDINGETLEEIVAAYKASVREDYVERLREDIDRFLATGAAGMDERFQAMFEPDIIPTAFRPTTQEFLQAIREGLGGD